MPQSNQEEKRLEQYLSAGHVDGVVLIGLHGDDPLAAQLAAHGVPIVISGRPPAGLRVSYVDLDNRLGARLAVEHLLSGGRRKIATITGTLDMTGAMDRLTGYREAIAAAGLPADPSLEEVGDFSQEIAARGMALLLERHPDIDGLFVASDSMAVTALRVLQDAGRRVPEDTAVVGFDDQPIARTTTPPLSSVHQPLAAMTGEMVRLVLESRDGRDRVARQVIFPPELVIRESSGGRSTVGARDAPDASGPSP
jgi:DNA-binding LacI/PurR family transcriptional regulator